MSFGSKKSNSQNISEIPPEKAQNKSGGIWAEVEFL